MRALIPFLLLCLLAGCPAPEETSEVETVASEPAVEVVPEAAGSPGAPLDEFPEWALTYLVESLANSDKDGHAPAMTIFEVTANLPAQPEYYEPVTGEAAAWGAEIPAQIVSAWLRQEPDAALHFVSDKLAEGSSAWLAALQFSPTPARQLFAELELQTIDKNPAEQITSLIRDWPDLAAGENRQADLALLKELALREDEIALRSIGMLIGLSEVSEEQRQRLIDGVGDSYFGAVNNALDGIRLSGDAQLAKELIQLLRDVPMQGEDDAKVSIQQLFAAHALAELPGEQASVMRKRLANAQADPIRLQAGLGELLFGDPSPWRAEIAKLGIDNESIYTVLRTPGRWHDDLLPTLEQAANSEQEQNRAYAAYFLNRYGDSASLDTVAELLAKLAVDQHAAVRRQAWMSAGMLQLTGLLTLAEQVNADVEREPEERLAAAYYALACAGEMERGSPAMENE